MLSAGAAAEGWETHGESGIEIKPDVLTIRERPPRPSAVALLEAEGLPASDLTEAHLEHFFYTGSWLNEST